MFEDLGSGFRLDNSLKTRLEGASPRALQGESAIGGRALFGIGIMEQIDGYGEIRLVEPSGDDRRTPSRPFQESRSVFRDKILFAAASLWTSSGPS